jgi:hypothetical protein
MSSNSAIIVQEIREEFESMLHYIQHSETETAYAAERNIFKHLLLLGHSLMLLFFIVQAKRYPRTEVEMESGEILPYHSDKKRIYFSIFGKLPVWRPYFYKQDVGSAYPLDEDLSLGEDSYSDMVREIAEYLGVADAYEKVTDLFRYLLGQSLGKNAVQLMVAKDAQDVEAYYEQKAAPEASEEGSILVVQADGKGVPLVKSTEVTHKVRLGKGEKRSKKKEAVVTSVYTIDPNPRQPKAVVASLFRQETAENEAEEPKARGKPQHKEVWATLDGKDTALARLASQVEKRQGEHIRAQVALTDGAEALQKRVLQHLPDFTLILDFIHANEYLWDAGNRLYQEQDPQRQAWVEKRSLDLLSGRTKQVIADLRNLAQEPGIKPAQQEQLHKTANYFGRNLEYMQYDDYLRKGWPIASGVIEGACRHLVKDRFELTGMRWTQEGAESLLRLRSVAENDDWEDYHAYRKEQRHLRLYASPPSRKLSLEQIALDSTTHSVRYAFFFKTATRTQFQPATAEQKLAA